MKLKNLLVIAFLFVSMILTAAKTDFVVALDGTGNFNKIQDAIDAVKPNQTKRTVIFIKNGLYNTEKILVSEDKKNITFVGESRENTIISYHIFDCKGGLNNKCPADDAAKWSGLAIRTSATISIYGDGFRAENITFQNTAGAVGQALAITICSDKNVFVNCAFMGYQDTIYLWTAGKRSYFYKCLILGRTDYIYGAGIAFFEKCEIRSFGGGWITAPSTPKEQAYGYVFYKCKLTFAKNSPRPKDDSQTVALGRPWHNYPKVAWIECDMCEKIDPAGWPTIWRMDYAATSSDLHLYEYKNTGKGADMSQRAKWVGLKSISSNEVENYSLKKVFYTTGRWNPKK